MTLVEFVTARLDEDELIARDADMSPERITGIPRSYASAPIAIHIARHDPARVLRDVEGKRRIVGLHQVGRDVCDEHDAELRSIPCETLRLLALPYADHEEFDESWRP